MVGGTDEADTGKAAEGVVAAYHLDAAAPDEAADLLAGRNPLEPLELARLHGNLGRLETGGDKESGASEMNEAPPAPILHQMLLRRL
ncbi:hypothetical protein GCM10010862_13950 [Devosia nitrariae]|uniref:Uncharacterized protein n=1 Tax=Devosia nitrariae TaxID=2071872 RepID=A0ABQ5W362_9HYPH|nr:hypothetical protein GCM10010862_13950 [Devosia nitrariae]